MRPDPKYGERAKHKEWRGRWMVMKKEEEGGSLTLSFLRPGQKYKMISTKKKEKKTEAGF